MWSFGGNVHIPDVCDQQVADLRVFGVEAECLSGRCLHLNGQATNDSLPEGRDRARNKVDPAVPRRKGDLQTGTEQFVDQPVPPEQLDDLRV